MALRIVIDVLIGIGLVFALAGTKGIIKMPDTFCRMQASTCINTMGVIGVALGALLYAIFIMGSASAAIKIGTEGVGDFRNVLVSNCVISRSNRGLSIQIRDGGNVENVSFSNISIETRRFCPDWWGTAEPIVLTSFNRDENTNSGTIKNIRFFNVTTNGENGVLIHGGKTAKISDVTFDHCRVHVTKTSKWPCGLYDLRPCLEYGVEKSTNAAFFLRGCKNITIENSSASFGNLCNDYKHAIDAENVENLTLFRFQGKAANDEEAIKINSQLEMRNSQ